MKINKRYFLTSLFFSWASGTLISAVYTPDIIMGVVKHRMVAEVGINNILGKYELATDQSRDVVRPNNDTLYSVAWLDLSETPMLLSIPDMKDRYYAFQFLGMDTSVFDVIGTRTRGQNEGVVLISNDLFGDCSGKYEEVVKIKGNESWLLARTLVDGQNDIVDAKQHMLKYNLKPMLDCEI